MKTVTIKLAAKTEAWARKQAAERNMSLSRFVAELLQQNMRQACEYERAMQRFFEGSSASVALRKSGDRYPPREQLYDRGRLR